MRHRHPQSIATKGISAGSPAAAATGGAVQPRNRFRYLGRQKVGVAGALDYVDVFEKTVDAANTELVKGEYVDDLAVLSGTSVA